MASEHRQAVALVYARALFELARERELAARVPDDLELLAATMEAEPAFGLFLESPAIARERKKTLLEKLFGQKVNELTMDFLGVLANKERLGLVRDIRGAYRQLEDEQAGRIGGTVITAVEMGPSDQIRLAEQIGRALRKTVSLQTTVNPEIIGGLILHIEGKVMDASIRGSLQKFSQHLRKRMERRSRRLKEKKVSSL